VDRLEGDEAEAPAGAAPDTAALSAEPPPGAAIPIVLPTRNHGLLTRDLPDFYMGVEEDTIIGLRTAAWEGGQYGFVRDSIMTPGGPRFRRLHEGLDIRPLHRDAAGEPLDTVRAIDVGRVVYANKDGASAFGRYVVVEHDWGAGPVYSLYAHLDAVHVDSGAAVVRGGELGRMGYTGRGLGRDRAHVHLEVDLMLNQHERVWHAQYVAGQANTHGVFFGTNLAGVDPEALYRTSRREPATTFPQFVRALPAGFRVALPGDRPLDVVARYPWLLDEGADAQPDAARAWAVTFTRGGVPIRVARLNRGVTRPEVIGLSSMVGQRYQQTNRLLQRNAERQYELSTRGRQLMALLATTADGAPSW
jgi:murein DD-endopeptidase MepM/ murein hydrolase activator NlpD